MKPKAIIITKTSKQKTTQSANETKQNHPRTFSTLCTISCATQTNLMVPTTANLDTNTNFQHEKIFLKIMQEGIISLSFEDMNHVSLLFAKFLCSFTTCPRSKTTTWSIAWVGSVKAYWTSDEKLYIASTLHVQVYLNREICKALINIGAKINVITKKAQDWFDLPIWLDPVLWLISYTGYSRDFVRMCENIDINVGGVTIKQNTLWSIILIIYLYLKRYS